jgi:uncharacterized membrane protein (UPF0127 family)
MKLKKSLKEKNKINISTHLIVLFTTVTLVVISICIVLLLNRQSNVDYISFPQSDNVKIAIEVADTQEKRAYGLMNRTQLDWDSGMLFVFEHEQGLAFWMKDTLIPLDILFIGENGEINTIHKNAEPKNTLKRYLSEKPSKYALEVNSGFVEQNRIEIGHFVKIH